MPDAFILLGRTCLHFVLLALPFFAACAFAIRKNLRDVVSVGLIGLAATALPGYVIFWSWFLSPKLIHSLATSALVAAVLWLFYFFKYSSREDRRILKILLGPLLLVFTSSLLILSTGFAYGGLRDPLTVATTRFSHQLPGDNAIPYIFLEGMIAAGHIPRPIMSNYNSSDRPPLQTAIALSQTPLLIVPRQLAYEILSAILQSLWIFVLWLLLFALGIRTSAIRCVLLTCLLSEFVFLNTFYVWPKLVAAGYTLGLITILFTGMLASAQRSKLLSISAGLLLAWGILSHGGTVFAVLGIPLTLLLFRYRIAAKNALILGVTAFVLYLPWIAYQKFYDPPGDRLLKWHLAGVQEPDPRPFKEALISAYGELSAKQIVSNKWENLKATFAHTGDYWQLVVRLLSSFGDPNGSNVRKEMVSTFHALWFFFLLPNLGFLMFGLLTLLAGIYTHYRSREWRSAVLLLAFVFVSEVVWGLLMFDTRSILLHAGAYVTLLLAYAGCVLALWAVSQWLAIVMAVLQGSLQAYVYLWLFHPAGQLQYGMITLAFIGLTATMLLLWKLPPSVTSTS